MKPSNSATPACVPTAPAPSTPAPARHATPSAPVGPAARACAPRPQAAPASAPTVKRPAPAWPTAPPAPTAPWEASAPSARAAAAMCASSPTRVAARPRPRGCSGPGAPLSHQWAIGVGMLGLSRRCDVALMSCEHQALGEHGAVVKLRKNNYHM